MAKSGNIRREGKGRPKREKFDENGNPVMRKKRTRAERTANGGDIKALVQSRGGGKFEQRAARAHVHAGKD